MHSEDDWLFDSIKIYKHLLMYDLQNVSNSLSWSSDKSICVASSKGDSSELLELSLPDKVLVSEETQGLCSDRDFRVICGGFTDRPLAEIKCLPNTRLVAGTHEDKNSLSIWNLGCVDSDLIKQTAMVENSVEKCCSASLDVTSRNIVFGSSVNDICFVDVETNKVVLDCKGVLPEVPNTRICKMFLNEHNLLACSQEKCEFWWFDTRAALKILSHHASIVTASSIPSHWTHDATLSSSENERVVSLESRGKMAAFDRRKLQEPFFTRNLSGFEKRVNVDTELITVKISPTSSEVLSVSGLDGCVHLYNTAAIEEGNILQAEFSHGGHMACSDHSETVVVSTHTWHPWQPDLILSSATDGSLHGWQRESSL